MKVWVVRLDEEGQLSAVLALMGADADALSDGRVFVGRIRVHDASFFVARGDNVRVAPKVAQEDGAPVRVLLERDGLVAVDKPAGLPTIADHAGAAHSLLATVARALGVRESGLHPTSRLDRGVSGVVIFARTDAARVRLAKEREAGRYERRYVALATRAPTPERGVWSGQIGRAKAPQLRQVNGRNATPSETRYAVVGAAPGVAMLALAPITGRTHQLRVHASHAGAPLLGDRDYGRATSVTLPSGEVLAVGRVALHCARVRLLFDSEEVVVSAEIPAELVSLATALGLAEDLWKKAVSCTL